MNKCKILYCPYNVHKISNYCFKHYVNKNTCSVMYCINKCVNGSTLRKHHIRKFINGKKLECNISRCKYCDSYLYDKSLCLHHYLLYFNITLEQEVNYIIK
jgi:hypothetical protein